jgi:fucose 4-O-acetylase-like acetyltransferase
MRYGKAVTLLAKFMGICVIVKNFPITIAPARIVSSIAEVLVVAQSAAESLSIVNWRLKNEITITPPAPMPLASVGETSLQIDLLHIYCILGNQTFFYNEG